MLSGDQTYGGRVSRRATAHLPCGADRPHGHGEAQRFPIAVGHAMRVRIILSLIQPVRRQAPPFFIHSLVAVRCVQIKGINHNSLPFCFSGRPPVHPLPGRKHSCPPRFQQIQSVLCDHMSSWRSAALAILVDEDDPAHYAAVTHCKLTSASQGKTGKGAS